MSQEVNITRTQPIPPPICTVTITLNEDDAYVLKAIIGKELSGRLFDLYRNLDSVLSGHRYSIEDNKHSVAWSAIPMY